MNRLSELYIRFVGKFHANVCRNECRTGYGEFAVKNYARKDRDSYVDDEIAHLDCDTLKAAKG